jgi:hypothetical protein
MIRRVSDTDTEQANKQDLRFFNQQPCETTTLQSWKAVKRLQLPAQVPCPFSRNLGALKVWQVRSGGSLKKDVMYIGFYMFLLTYGLIDRGDAVNECQWYIVKELSKTHCMTCQLLHTYCRFNLNLCPSMPYFNPLVLRSYLSLFLKQISSRCLHWVPVSYSIPWWCDASDLFWWRCGNRDVVASSRRGLSSLSSQTIGAHRKIS